MRRPKREDARHERAPAGGPCGLIATACREARLTNVADMPGYPTKKLLFGGPDTRTNAAMVVAKSER